MYAIAQLALLVLAALSIVDAIILYSIKQGIKAERKCQDKFSNGDNNEISIYLQSKYNLVLFTEVIDEIPFQFQVRDLSFKLKLNAQESQTLYYQLRPVKRGEYDFGSINVFISSPLQLLTRRYRFAQPRQVKVYPSFLQMRKYELLAISDRLVEAGIKKIRKIGHNLEFEQIKDYVQGDDIRTINWKATARRNQLMVNHYQDEKSQQVYSVIDKGRSMKMPFEGMSLLDYAINATLVISNIAMLKSDRAGLITFGDKIDTILKANRSHSQMQGLMESLYNQKTDFKESAFEKLYSNVKKQVNQRSLLILYTNFESLSGLKRQLPYLRRLAFNHLLLVVFFDNTELKSLINTAAKDTEEIYLQTIAEQFAFEKRQIVKELQRHGIQALLTTPQNLTVDSINKYLEFKARGLI